MGGFDKGDHDDRVAKIIPFPVSSPTPQNEGERREPPARVHRLPHDVAGWFGLTRPQLLPRRPLPPTYVLDATITGSQPRIWRRLELAGDLELGQVAEAVRTSFGWSGNVLHLFTLSAAVPHGAGVVLSPGYGGWGRAGHDEAGVQLQEVLLRTGEGLTLTIIDEGGDEWALQLQVEELIAPHPYRRARCLAGERRRPPVDAEDIEQYNMAVAQWSAGISAGQRVVWWPESHDPAHVDVASADQLVALVIADPVTPMPTAARIDVRADLVDLYLRCMSDAQTAIDNLLADAEIRPDVALPDDVATLVRPWEVMLEVVGDGIDFSGRRVPDDVERRLAEKIPTTEPPAGALVECGERLGLLRKVRGELVPTAVARRSHERPDLLWRHLADRLPVSRDRRSLDAGLVVMLQVAAGRDPSYAVVARVLNSAGWTDDGDTIGSATARAWSAGTRQALAFTGARLGVQGALHVTDAARALCSAALAPGSRDRRASRSGGHYLR